MTPASLATQYLNLAKEGDEYLARADAGKVKILNLMLSKAESVAAQDKDKEAGKAILEQVLHLRGEVLWDMKDYKSLLTLFRTELGTAESDKYQFSEYLGPLEQLAKDDEVFAAHQTEIEGVFLQGLTVQLQRAAPVASYAPQNTFIMQMFRRTTAEELTKLHLFITERKLTTLAVFVQEFTKLDPETLDFWGKVLRLLALYMEKLMVQQQDKFRSKNYLMHLLQILEVLSQQLGSLSDTARALATDTIGVLVGWGKHTLTVVDELQGFTSMRKDLLTAVQKELSLMTSEKDNSNRASLEYQEMCLRFLVEVGDAHHAQESVVIEWVNKFFQKYEDYENLFYKDQEKIRLEKGERLLHDNYLLGAVELIRVDLWLTLDPREQTASHPGGIHQERSAQSFPLLGSGVRQEEHLQLRLDD